MGSDLLQISSSDEVNYVINVLKSRPAFSLPAMPGYYHTGLHQRQSGKQFYQRNGVRV